MVQRADDLKVKYEGSTTQRNVQEILEQLAIEEVLCALILFHLVVMADLARNLFC